MQRGYNATKHYVMRLGIGLKEVSSDGVQELQLAWHLQAGLKAFSLDRLHPRLNAKKNFVLSPCEGGKGGNQIEVGRLLLVEKPGEVVCVKGVIQQGAVWHFCVTSGPRKLGDLPNLQAQAIQVLQLTLQPGTKVYVRGGV